MINLVEQKFILSTDIETIRRWAFPLHQFSLFFTPLLSSHGDVLRKALTIEPGFATMDIAHIEEVFRWRHTTYSSSLARSKAKVI